MNDIELNALATLVHAEIAAMEAENTCRADRGVAPAYDDSMMTGLDCVKCLDAELRRRGVLKTPGTPVEIERAKDYGNRVCGE
jgi:hypothetical protein